MEKFNDELTAIEAIASSPDITQSVVDSHEEGVDNTEQTSAIEAVNVAPSSSDTRNARLLSLIGKETVRVLGAEIDKDQLSAAEEIASEGFCSLNLVGLPRWARITITSSLLLGSFVPMGLVAWGAFTGKETDNDND